MRPTTKRLLAGGLLLGLGLAAGCATPPPAPPPGQQGFLSSYETLERGEGHRSERVRVAADADLSGFDKVVLDPVTVWRGAESRADGLSPAQLQLLSDYVYALLKQELAKRFELVSAPSPDTLRVQVALTKRDEADVVVEIFSRVLPRSRTIELVESFAANDLAMTGAAQLEYRIGDAVSGAILVEGLDRKVGGRPLDTEGLPRWGDASTVLRFWVDRFAYDLCTAQRGHDCGDEPAKAVGKSS